MKHEELAIEIFARIDALFTRYPHPKDHPKALSAISERRREFLEHGLPFVGGGSPSERKQMERSLGELQDDGVLSVSRGARRRVAVRFTPEGDAIIRNKLWVFRPFEVWHWLPTLAKSKRKIVSESVLLGFKRTDNSDKQKTGRAGLCNEMLPLLTLGVVDAWHDTYGIHGYSITESGTEALKSPAPVRPELPEPSEEEYDRCCELYNETLEEATRERLNWDIVGTVAIPLGAGSW
jgi:hypothetical protein